MKPQKIVVLGGPHSGKSVFLYWLAETLPRALYALMRLCPDGEGTWLSQNYDDPKVRELRRKGTFTKEIVAWYAESLAKNQMAPIVLVDVGGRPSDENRKILSEGGVQHAIVLEGKLGRVKEWREFCSELGIEIIAEISSNYVGKKDIVRGVRPDGVWRGSVHYLERGEDCSDRPVIKAVAELIESLAENVQVERTTSLPSFASVTGALIRTPDLARRIGKEVDEKIWWYGHELSDVAEVIKDLKGLRYVDIDGPMVNWLAANLVCQLDSSQVSLNSPDGFVPVVTQGPWGKGTQVEWRVEELPDTNGVKTVHVEFKLDPSRPLKPADLVKIRPPRVDKGVAVVISGRGPMWLYAGLALAYKGIASAIACFQPNKATVAWTETEDLPLGSVFDVQPLVN